MEKARYETLVERRAQPLRPASATKEPTGLYLAVAQTLRSHAHRRPAVGPRQVFVIGDAETLVPQESSQEAANALLKLLEEPSRVGRKLGEAVGGLELGHEPCGVPRRTRGERTLLDDRDIGYPTSGEVVRDAASDDAAADHQHLHPAWKLAHPFRVPLMSRTRSRTCRAARAMDPVCRPGDPNAEWPSASSARLPTGTARAGRETASCGPSPVRFCWWTRRIRDRAQRAPRSATIRRRGRCSQLPRTTSRCGPSPMSP